MLWDVVKEIVLGLIGIAVASYLVTRFTIRRKCEWAISTPTQHLLVLYGLWMCIGVFCSYLLVFETGLFGTAIVMLLSVVLTVFLDKEYCIGFFELATIADIFWAVVLCQVFGVVAFHLANSII